MYFFFIFTVSLLPLCILANRVNGYAYIMEESSDFHFAVLCYRDLFYTLNFINLRCRV